MRPASPQSTSETDVELLDSTPAMPGTYREYNKICWNVPTLRLAL